VENWDQFTEFREFQAWVSEKGFNGFHFKAWKAQFLGLGNFFHSFFPEWPRNKGDPSVQSPLGELTYKNLVLDPSRLFAPRTEKLRQGDIIEHKEGCGFPDSGIPAPTHWIVVSQTCVVENENKALLSPCYLKTHFWARMDPIKPKQKDNTGYLGQVTANRTNRFLVFPVKDGLWEEPLIADLGVIGTIPCDALRALTPITSLTYPAVAYFTNRLAALLFRDVENCDDSRNVK
jgi:hypothetical protein